MEDLNNGIGKDATNRILFIGDFIAHIQVPYGKTRFNAYLKKVINFNRETGRIQVENKEGAKSWIEPYNCIKIGKEE